MKAAVWMALRVIALTLVLFACFAVAGGVVRIEAATSTVEPAGQTALTLLAVCFLEAAVLSYIIVRSRWRGWRLMAAIFVAFYGVTTFMSQIESAVFITSLPPGVLPRLFLMGALIAAPFSVVAVLILGKRKAAPAEAGPNDRLVMSGREWAMKLAIIAVVYVILYFTFGYFVAWKNPAVPQFYGQIDEGTFGAHMAVVLRTTPWLVPFQILRALLWVAIALPVIRMMKEWQETALAIALLFSVVMNAQLLLPNPYMPEPVRMAHLVETASSNFIFGAFIGWLLARPARRNQ